MFIAGILFCLLFALVVAGFMSDEPGMGFAFIIIIVLTVFLTLLLAGVI